MSTPSIAERVTAGAAWLDEQRPGWGGRINVSTLDLSNPCLCVLGQVFGEYWGVAGILGYDENDVRELMDFRLWAVKRGFCRHISEGWAGWRRLENAWRELILARREQAGADR